MNLFSKARLLTPEEWERLTPLASHFQGAIPTPDVADVLVVEQGDEIVGLLTLEKITHVGPIWVKDDARGQGVFNDLFRLGYRLLPPLRGTICLTSNPKVVRLVKRLNLREIISQRVFVWER